MKEYLIYSYPKNYTLKNSEIVTIDFSQAVRASFE